MNVADDDLVSRRALRHQLLRARNERTLAAGPRADVHPVELRMHPDTLTELLVDGDPAESSTMDYEGMAFMGVPIRTDERLDPGRFELLWESPLQPDP